MHGVAPSPLMVSSSRLSDLSLVASWLEQLKGQQQWHRRWWCRCPCLKIGTVPRMSGWRPLLLNADMVWATVGRG